MKQILFTYLFIAAEMKFNFVSGIFEVKRSLENVKQQCKYLLKSFYLTLFLHNKRYYEA